jgi:hypothetical protein
VPYSTLPLETRGRGISNKTGAALAAKPHVGKGEGPNMVGEPCTLDAPGGIASILRRRQRDVVLPPDDFSWVTVLAVSSTRESENDQIAMPSSMVHPR